MLSLHPIRCTRQPMHIKTCISGARVDAGSYVTNKEPLL